uniref:FH2 domain-containing protein n=1 Tax=Mucochytrium quahogii TaxID=96639 RepID=A0A7S2RF41_9STRA|mmetsp:Transcript_14183/g.30702  ORF Transcript_14183/g.30702 Transcript_14183/m.30702 type:complete len:1090 (+) Transcript_14183:1234-4503(+)
MLISLLITKQNAMRNKLRKKSEKCKELERENISLRVTETSNGPSPLEPNDKVASETMTKRQVIKLLQLRGIDPALVFGETKRKTWGEDETYGKYFKMLAEKVPRASVEKEMQDGGLDITVLNNNPGDLVPASAQKNALLEKSGPSLKDDERYGKYFKMLAVKVPRGAIEVKMRNEGLDPAFLDLDPESPAPDVAGAAKTEISGPSSRKTTNNEKKLKDDPRYAPFLKMIAVKVPKGAVISKMQSKGLDPKYLDMDPETTMIPQEKEEDKTAAKSGDDASKVRLKDDPNYGPFFKMLAVKVPKQAIVNKMLAKGLDPEYLDKDPGSFAPQPQVEEQGDGQTSGVKLKDDPDYGPFFKMLAVKVPKQAIVNKMLAKGLDPAYLDKDPESFAPQPVSKEAPLDRVKLKDDPKYGPFFKMLAVKVPKQAVANKMLAKGLDPTYLDKDPESFAPQPVAPTKKDVKDVKLKDDPRYGPFFKMLAVKVPKQAVVNKLLAKGLDPKYLDMDPDSPAPASEPPEGGTQPGSGPIVMLKDDKRYGPFFKMLAVKVPKPAIINKMKNKGLDPKYIDMDPESPAPPEPQAAMTKLKDDKRYGPFFKMLAVKVPKPAVINKMVNKGLDPKYLDMDPESPAPPESGASAAATPAPPKPPIKKPDKIVRRKLHWRKVTKQALEKNEKCVWNTCDRFVFEQREINEMTLCFAVNISEQERQKEREKAAKAAESGQGKGDQASAASKPAAKKVEKKILLDTMRSNNISIVLSRMKGVTAAVVRKCVCSLDIDEDEVSIEDLRSVLNLMPTPEEENVLKAYKGERNILGKAEAYFMELMDIPRYKQRVKCFLYKMKFEDLFEDASMDFKMINSACKEILSSKKFCRLLEIVLALGNFMNEGDDAPRTRLAVGFTMDSLSKLRQVKSFQQQTTALHYLVMLIQARQRDIIGFIKSGTDNIRAAASVSLSNALAQLQMLENGFKVLENEHKLVAAIVSNPEKRDNLSEEDKLFFLGLNKFYNLAEKSLEELRQEGNDTEQRFKETLDFLCEDPSTTSEVFFRTLQTFFADFELALNQNDAARQKHLKKERARMERNSKTKKGSVPAKRK